MSDPGAPPRIPRDEQGIPRDDQGTLRDDHGVPRDDPDAKAHPPPAASFRQTASAVLWSLFGVRKRGEFEKDVRLNPAHVVIMGLVAAAVFVLTLVLIVKLIIGNV